MTSEIGRPDSLQEPALSGSTGAAIPDGDKGRWEVIDIKRIRERAKETPRKQSSTDRLRRWLDRVEPELEQMIERKVADPDQLRRIVRERLLLGTVPMGRERNRVRISKERRKLNNRLMRVVTVITRILGRSDWEDVRSGLELTG